MTTSLILAGLILGAGLLVWVLSRSRKVTRGHQQAVPGPGPELLHSVVPASEKNADPYPYIYVNADGTARDLHSTERIYLETTFRQNDPARPYVKGSYEQKNGWGEVRGFMPRSELPAEVYIAAAPLADPNSAEGRSERFLQFPKTHAAWDTDEEDSDDARRSRG